MAMVPACLNLEENDVKKMLIANVQLGSRNLDKKMETYIFGRQSDGTFMFNIAKTWEKLMLAARVLVTITNPADIAVVAGRPDAQRAVLKFCRFVGATSYAGRFTPGAFTNRVNPNYREPRVLIVNDPVVDRQAILESSYTNIPVIAFCNSDASLRFVDIVIPCNNKSPKAIGLMYWFLAREILRMKGAVVRTSEWTEKPDLFVPLSQQVLDKMAEDENTKEAENDSFGKDDFVEDNNPFDQD